MVRTVSRSTTSSSGTARWRRSARLRVQDQANPAAHVVTSSPGYYRQNGKHRLSTMTLGSSVQQFHSMATCAKSVESVHTGRIPGGGALRGEVARRHLHDQQVSSWQDAEARLLHAWKLQCEGNRRSIYALLRPSLRIERQWRDVHPHAGCPDPAPVPAASSQALLAHSGAVSALTRHLQVSDAATLSRFLC